VKWGFWHSDQLAEDLVPIIWGASLTNGKTLGNKPLVGLDLYKIENRYITSEFCQTCVF
jgi:hypothetical protein